MVQIADNVLYPIRQGKKPQNQKENGRIFAQESTHEIITKKMYW